MKKIMSLLMLILVFLTQSILAGEPVPGAEIFLELEPDEEPIQDCKEILVKDDCSVICISPKGANVPDAVYSSRNSKVKLKIKKGKAIKGCQPGSKSSRNKGRFSLLRSKSMQQKMSNEI